MLLVSRIENQKIKIKKHRRIKKEESNRKREHTVENFNSQKIKNCKLKTFLTVI